MCLSYYYLVLIEEQARSCVSYLWLQANDCVCACRLSRVCKCSLLPVQDMLFYHNPLLPGLLSTRKQIRLFDHVSANQGLSSSFGRLTKSGKPDFVLFRC